MLGPLFQLDRQQRDSLIDVVVELSRDPGALLFMGLNQPAADACKSLFCQFTLRDVRHHSYRSQHLSSLVEEGSRAFLQPNHRTIGTQDAIANVGSRVLGTNLVDRTDKQCAIVWMDSGHQLLPSKLLRQVAETEDTYVLRGSRDRVGCNVPLVGIHLSCLSCQTKPLLAFLELSGSDLAFLCEGRENHKGQRCENQEKL